MIVFFVWVGRFFLVCCVFVVWFLGELGFGLLYYSVYFCFVFGLFVVTGVITRKFQGEIVESVVKVGMVSLHPICVQ